MLPVLSSLPLRETVSNGALKCDISFWEVYRELVYLCRSIGAGFRLWLDGFGRIYTWPSACWTSPIWPLTVACAWAAPSRGLRWPLSQGPWQGLLRSSVGTNARERGSGHGC